MRWQEAKRFEESLQQAAQGKKIDQDLALLVHTSQEVSRLAELELPRLELSLGRQQFLTEAVRLREEKVKVRPGLYWMSGKLRLVSVLAVVILLAGLAFGVGQATAASLPGGPFYALKLAAEEALLGLTTRPQARADLTVALAEERLDEIEAMLDKGESIDTPVTGRAQAQLAQAVAATNQATGEAGPGLLDRLTLSIQARRQRILDKSGELSESQQQAVQELLRAMEQARHELRQGQGEVSGEQERVHQGTPAQPTPQGPVEQPGAGSGPEETPEPGGPNPTEQPGPGPQPTDVPGNSGSPAGPGTGPGPGPNPTDDASGPGGQPTDQPGKGGGKPDGASNPDKSGGKGKP